MKIKVVRTRFSEKATVGKLYIDDKEFCYTLEDKVRPTGEKVDGETAIPYGIYPLIIDFSNRFQKMMPHVCNVPGFEGIRIHCGNTDKDTEGCLLLGRAFDINSPDFIGESKLAFDAFFPKLQEVLKKEKVTIEYVKESI